MDRKIREAVEVSDKYNIEVHINSPELRRTYFVFKNLAEEFLNCEGLPDDFYHIGDETIDSWIDVFNEKLKIARLAILKAPKKVELPTEEIATEIYQWATIQDARGNQIIDVDDLDRLAQAICSKFAPKKVELPMKTNYCHLCEARARVELPTVDDIDRVCKPYCDFETVFDCDNYGNMIRAIHTMLKDKVVI